MREIERERRERERERARDIIHTVRTYVHVHTVNREIFVVKIFSYGLLAYEN